jgi:hypothetical protein
MDKIYTDPHKTTKLFCKTFYNFGFLTECYLMEISQTNSRKRILDERQ